MISVSQTSSEQNRVLISNSMIGGFSPENDFSKMYFDDQFPKNASNLLYTLDGISGNWGSVLARISLVTMSESQEALIMWLAVGAVIVLMFVFAVQTMLDLRRFSFFMDLLSIYKSL